MGRTTPFRCPGCGCEAVASGGWVWGMFSTTQTIVCRDCRELFDVAGPGVLWD